MPAATITAVPIPHTMTGHVLSDAGNFTTLVAGAGNGVKFKWEPDLLVILRCDNAGGVLFTIKLRTAAPYTGYSASVANPAKDLVQNEEYLLRLDDIFRAADGFVYIEVDDTDGKVKVLRP